MAETENKKTTTNNDVFVAEDQGSTPFEYQEPTNYRLVEYEDGTAAKDLEKKKIQLQGGKFTSSDYAASLIGMAGARQDWRTATGKTPEPITEPVKKEEKLTPAESRVWLQSMGMQVPDDDADLKALMKALGPETIRLGRINHNAQLYSSIVAQQKQMASDIRDMLTTMYDPTGRLKISPEEAEARFKPQVSRRALDEMKGRGPYQIEKPGFETSETAILANVITSAIGGAMKSIGLAGKDDRQQALATTEMPPELRAMLQSAEMIRSDIAQYDAKVERIENVNHELAVKHQDKVDALEAEFDAKMDLADRVYKNNLENYLQYHQQRFDTQNNMARAFEKMAQQTELTEDQVRLGVDKTNVSLQSAEQRFNAMARMQAKRMTHAYLSAKKAKRASSSMIDPEGYVKKLQKAQAINPGNTSITYYGNLAAKSIASVPKQFFSGSNMQTSGINADSLKEEFRKIAKASPEAANTFYKNATILMANGIEVPSNPELTAFLADNKFSLSRSIFKLGKTGSEAEALSVIMSDTEDGKSLLNLLAKNGSLKIKEGGDGYEISSAQQARARMGAFYFNDSIMSLVQAVEQQKTKLGEGQEVVSTEGDFNKFLGVGY